MLSQLDDADVSSAANVDAGVRIRKEPERYKVVQEHVETAKRDIPARFKMPGFVETKPPEKEEVDDGFGPNLRWSAILAKLMKTRIWFLVRFPPDSGVQFLFTDLVGI